MEPKTQDNRYDCPHEVTHPMRQWMLGDSYLERWVCEACGLQIGMTVRIGRPNATD